MGTPGQPAKRRLVPAGNIITAPGLFDPAADLGVYVFISCDSLAASARRQSARSAISRYSVQSSVQEFRHFR